MRFSLDFIKKILKKRKKERSLFQDFETFRKILSANDQFLRSLAELIELDKSKRFSLSTVVKTYEQISDCAEAMVSCLVEMTGDKYQELIQKYVTLDREVNLEVLKSHPVEVAELIIWPDKNNELDVNLVGGKAKGLAEIIRRTSINVPPFFIVTPYATRILLESNGIQDEIGERLWSCDYSDYKMVKKICEHIHHKIINAKVPKPISDAVQDAVQKLKKLHPCKFGFAVRSSASVEDTKTSFAGQFETILGVKEADVLNAWIRVIASKYRFQTLEFIRLEGFLDEEVTMSVIIMPLIRPKISGVAFSRSPRGGDFAEITVVEGLAEPLCSGRVMPDRYEVCRYPPYQIIGYTSSNQGFMLQCLEDGGLIEQEVSKENKSIVNADLVSRVAEIAISIEKAFGKPQDVEWAIDEISNIYVVQSRDLKILEPESQIEEYPTGRILLRGGTSVCQGVATGLVRKLLSYEDIGISKDTVLVIPSTSPKLAHMILNACAVIAETGSPTGHMATIARENNIPCIVGMTNALSILKDGQLVTVDSRLCNIYEGDIKYHRKPEESKEKSQEKGYLDPTRRCLRELIEKVSPLTLKNPNSPDFTVQNCKTLHDIARFVHQKIISEFFETDISERKEKRYAKRLLWKAPMDLLVIDLGGGISGGNLDCVTPDNIISQPFSALLEGMTDPRLRWAGPVGFNLKGFMSVVIMSAADDQRYGEPAYALISKDFLHFSSRLAYHFATVASLCSDSQNQNYAKFQFYGGGSVAERRELRAYFLETVLRANMFDVVRVGDKIDACLSKQSKEITEDALVMLGRLMVCSRHLDMLMESRDCANAYAEAFLAGDYGFDFVKKRG